MSLYAMQFEEAGPDRLKLHNGARYMEFAMFFREQLTKRDINIGQAFILFGSMIPKSTLYQWAYGYRIPTPPQLKLIEKRLQCDTPFKYLMGLDRFGVAKKDRQLTLPGLREAKR